MIVVGVLDRPRRGRRQFRRAAHDLRHPDINDGVSFVPIAIGPFGIAEMIQQPRAAAGLDDFVGTRISNLVPSRADLAAAFPAIACAAPRSAACCGVLPGGGAALPAVLRLSRSEKKIAADPSRFGKGAIEGVAGAGGRQQCRRADQLHPAADARHPVQPADGADDRRADDPGHPARPAGDDRAARSCSGA